MMNEAALFLASALTLFSSSDISIDENNYEKIIIGTDVYTLSFEDNFDGNELDPAKWERCPEMKRQDLNNYWDDDMSYLDGKGNLVLGMSYDEESDSYLSGAVRTRGIFEQKYGYFEIRCTLNELPGCWTAFWLMGDSVVSELNGGKDGTEIDIYESPYYSEKQIQHTLNWDGYGFAHDSEGWVADADVYDGDYHIFSLLWTQDEYVFYIDHEETWRTDAKKARGTCEVPLYLKISWETGSWTGVPDKTDLPADMRVDHVRVYAALNAD